MSRSREPVHAALRPPTWLGVEFRHLLALDAVADQASFIRAAAALGYTQSAVSQQIAALERVVGQKLVERPGGTHPVRLTRAGEILVEHARAIGARLSTAQADLSAAGAGETGPVRVGTLQSIGALLLPGILRRFGRRQPKAEVRLIEAHSDSELAGLLERGEVDLGFVHLPAPSASLECFRLLDDEYVLLVPEGSPLGACGRVPTLEDLAATRLVGFNQCRSFQQVIEYFRAHGLRPAFALRSDDVATIQGFVAADLGAALVPSLAAEALLPGIRLVELDGLIPPRRVGLARSLERVESGPARGFVAAAIEHCARRSSALLKAAS
jgi:DNA-binding transcriptional LysR family regulator